MDVSGKTIGLNLNAKKTKGMHIGKFKNQEHQTMHINAFELIYLGSVKTDDSSCSKDIKTRIVMAKL